MMVARCLSVQDRFVYLPADRWVDYQTGKSYDAGWHRIAAGEILP